MLYSKQLSGELIQLINQKNQSSFVDGDLVFEFLSRQPTGEMTVKVTASPGVHYYGEQEITYTRRSLTNALKGVPVKLVVGNSVDMRTLLGLFSTKYGFEFDETIDFLQSELDKAVDFSESGLVSVTLPTADTSNIWIGGLSITVSNDALNLDAIIQNVELLTLPYLQTEDAKGSLDLATWPIQHEVDGLPMKTGLTSISRAVVSALLANMVNDGSVKQEDSDAILSAVMFNGDDTTPFNVMVDDTVDPVGFISVLFSSAGGKFSTPNLQGAAWIRYPNKVPPIRYVMKTDGGKVNLTLAGWTDIKVDWGDGSPVETEGTAFEHTYSDTTSRTIIASGTVDNQYGRQVIRGFNITEIVEWDNGLFYCPETNNCQKLIKVPNSIPTTWTSLEKLFAYASTFNGPEVLEWNVSNIYSMASTFTGAAKFNQPIGIWDVSKVTDMDFMFGTAYQFNQPLNNWNVSKVRDFSFMFSSANAFNQPLDQWDMSSATTLSAMFSSAAVFNGDVSTWDVSGVTSMANMFSNAKAFNGDISQWQTSSLKQIDYFMRNNTIFNQDLSGWDVSKITSGLTTMAEGATAWEASHRPGYVAPIASKFVLATLAAGDIKISVQTIAGDAAPWYKLSDGIKRSFTDGMFATKTVTGADTLEIGWNEASTDVRVSVQGTAITEIKQFDTVGNTTQYDFQRSPNLTKVPAALPANVVRTSSMFYYCTNFNGTEVVGWDVSHVTSMGQMFQNATTFNQDLSAWNTDAVTSNTWFADGATAWEVAKQPTFANAS